MPYILFCTLLVLQPEYHWAVMAEHWPRYLSSCFLLPTRDAHPWCPPVMPNRDAQPWCPPMMPTTCDAHHLWCPPMMPTHGAEVSFGHNYDWVKQTCQCQQLTRVLKMSETQSSIHPHWELWYKSITSALLTFWAWPPHVPVLCQSEIWDHTLFGSGKWTGQIEDFDSIKGHVHYCASENLAVASLETTEDSHCNQGLQGDLCMY